jgi:hypothetical protein
LLDGGYKGELHRFASCISGFRARRLVGDPFEVRVRVRFKPRYVCGRHSFWHFVGGWSMLVWQHALGMLATGERVQAGVRGDAVEPRTKVPAVESIEATPRAQIGLLHEILGIVQGAKHAVTMQFDFAPEWFGEPFESCVVAHRTLPLT